MKAELEKFPYEALSEALLLSRSAMGLEEIDFLR
jgi:hypothetical protein